MPLTTGDHDGTASVAEGVVLSRASMTRDYTDPYATVPAPRPFLAGAWTSPAMTAEFPFAELVPTWHAVTPVASWVEVAARARSADAWSEWLVLARWADHDDALHPTSIRHPPGAGTTVDTDRLLVPEGGDAWQLRITLLAPGATREPASCAAGEPDGPLLTYAGVMISGVVEPAAPSEAGTSVGRVLEVPPLSQRIHAGHYPRWGGGGESWCSPTSVMMVLRFWGVGPDEGAVAWVDPSYPDRSVYHAVRHCWDHAYEGAGNWSFNAAYAARFGLDAFVTRLRDLTEAEAFIDAGIPLVASTQIDPAVLSGADYTSEGHLVVIAGFTAGGDVVVNDPAARDPATLRRVYRRDEFEHAWRTGSSGIVYVIHPPSVALPRRPAEANW